MTRGHAEALGYLIGGVTGYAFGKYTYDWAISGDCGCDIWESALAAGSAGKLANNLSQYGSLIGAVGGAIAASGPIGMIVVGGFGLTASSVDLLRTSYSIYADGMSVCKGIRLIGDVIGMATSASAIQAGLTEIYAPTSASIPIPDRQKLVRDPRDIEWQQNHNTAPAAKQTGDIGTSPSQNAQIDEIIRIFKSLGAKDIRKNQYQVNIGNSPVGRIVPDLQLTINGRRIYLEWDRASSLRGPNHAYRIQANDPSAKGVLLIDANFTLLSIDDLIQSILNGDDNIILIILD